MVEATCQRSISPGDSPHWESVSCNISNLGTSLWSPVAGESFTVMLDPALLIRGTNLYRVYASISIAFPSGVCSKDNRITRQTRRLAPPLT